MPWQSGRCRHEPNISKGQLQTKAGTAHLPGMWSPVLPDAIRAPENRCPRCHTKLFKGMLAGAASDVQGGGAGVNERICIWCGNPLPSRRRSYCSDACRDARWHKYWSDATETAKKAVGYRPMMWPAIAAEQIRLYPSCSRCGSVQNLEAHHIRPLHSGGSNELSNLITLCHDCHRAQHKSKPRENDASRTVQGALSV